MTLKGPSGSDNKTLKDPQGLLLHGGPPLDSQGANGDWWSRDGGGLTTSRNQPTIVYGPKANGVWPTEFKRVMPNAPRYLVDAKDIVTTGIGPVALGLGIVENIGTAPTAGPFTNVTAGWADVAGTFYNNNRANTTAAVMASIPTPSYSNPPPLTQFGLVTVNTLPSVTDGVNGVVGVGSLHATNAPYGYAVWVSNTGRFCLGQYNAGLATSGAGGYLTATGTGVVTAGRKIAFLRIGSYIQGFVFTNTGVLVAGSTLAVTMDGSFDSAFASGPAVFARGTQDSRLSFFYGLT